jgi:hypothetical protein
MDREYKEAVLGELDRWTVHEADVVFLEVGGVSLTIHQAVRSPKQTASVLWS